MGCELLITQDEGLAPRHDGAAEAERRRGARRLADASRTSSCSAAPAATSRCRRAATSGGTTSSRARATTPSRAPASRWTRRTCSTCSTRAGTTAKPKGIVAHDRRLPRRRRDDAPLHLRHQARLGVLVRGRRRLGDRAQLHRLRAAVQRHDRRHLRGHARTSRTRTAGGRSSSATRSTSSTRRRPRSART